MYRRAWQATVHAAAKESNTTERLNDIVRMGPSWWDWCSRKLKEVPESLSSLLLCHEREEEDITVCKPEREVPLETQPCWHSDFGFQPSELWENKPWLFKSPVYGILWWQPKLRQAGKDGAQEEKVATQDKMVQTASPTQWTEFEQAPGDSEGQGSLACCSPWGHKESDTT